jgi:catechol 2,3-dioxygenase-like lactoylglutathione lyase family enzyme
MIPYTKAFSGFSVDDLQKAKTFYRETLGLKVIDNPMRLIELVTDGNNNIVVYPKPNHTPATFTIFNFVVDNIDEAVDALHLKGVIFEQYGAPIKTNEKGICRNQNGPNIAWFKDPAGNILSIIEQK